MACWLIKTEPDEYSWADLERDEETAWTGVRNFAARNNLRAMAKGDLCLFYHSMSEKAVVGVAEVASAAYPDPTAHEGDWSSVDVRPAFALDRPVTLARIRADKPLAGMELLRQSRLSVCPVTKAQYERIVKLGGKG
jgi:predicted RNA-binding protein with PUA-like domain